MAYFVVRMSQRRQAMPPAVEISQGSSLHHHLNKCVKRGFVAAVFRKQYEELVCRGLCVCINEIDEVQGGVHGPTMRWMIHSDWVGHNDDPLRLGWTQ